MLRIISLSLPLLVAPATGIADPAPTAPPKWCCPDQCIVDEGGARLLPRNDGSGEFDLLLKDVRVPVMPGAFHGASKGQPMQYCIGYDAFGNRQVKCLFVPSLA